MLILFHPTRVADRSHKAVTFCPSQLTQQSQIPRCPRDAQRVLTLQYPALKASFLTLLLLSSRGISDSLPGKSASIERACEDTLAESGRVGVGRVRPERCVIFCRARARP